MHELQASFYHMLVFLISKVTLDLTYESSTCINTIFLRRMIFNFTLNACAWGEYFKGSLSCPVDP